MVTRHATLGAYLRQIREQMHLTQSDLALGLGVTQHMVSRWESGGYRMRVDQFASLVLALRMSPDQIMEAVRIVGGVPTVGGRHAPKQ